MNRASTAHPTVATLEVPGARLHYGVRGERPLLVLVGSRWTPRTSRRWPDLLAAHHPVLTTDGRGDQPQPPRRPRPGLDAAHARPTTSRG